MATEILTAPYGEMRSATTAGGGQALTTTPAFIHLLPATSRVQAIARNFSTAVVAQLALCPYLLVLRTQDSLATATDYSENAQDASTSTDVVMSSQDTAANGDYLYVGSWLPFRGVVVDVDAANANASVLTVNYWNGSSWASITPTDGTDAAGATLGQDGNVTWTVPSDWAAAKLTALSPTPGGSVPYRGEEIYWTRWQVSAALDASTTLNSMLAMPRSTAYWEMVANQVLEARLRRGNGNWAAIEARTDAGTANLIVNVGATPRF